MGGFSTAWVNEPHILHSRFTGDVSLGDVNMVMLEFLGTAQMQPVYLLLDFSEAQSLPEGVLGLSSASQLVNHGNVCWLAIVNPEKRQTRSQYVTRMLANGKVKMFDGAQNALAFLRGMVRIDTGSVLSA